MGTPAPSSSATSPNLNSSKYKKSKTDIIRAACGAHLKQKCLVPSEKFRKSDFHLLQSKKQFAIQKMVETDLKNENTFTYSNVLCLSNNQHIADQQFSKFTQFVEDQDDTLRFELRRFYGPMLCHLFLELLRSREVRYALDFLRKYAQLIAPVDDYELGTPTRPYDFNKEDEIDLNHFPQGISFIHETLDADDPDQEYFVRLVTALSKCNRIETVDNDPTIAQFRSAKYEIHTTQTVFNELKSYLHVRGHVILMNLLQTWIHVHIIDNEINQWTEEFLFLPQDENAKEESREPKPKVEKSSQKRPAEEPTDAFRALEENDESDDKKPSIKNMMEFHLKTLSQCRETIMKSQHTIPRFIKLSDSEKQFTSADFDANECHLASGFNDSSVRLWQLNEKWTLGHNHYRCLSNRLCPWDLNNLKDTLQEDEEEEEDTDPEMDDPIRFEAQQEKYLQKKNTDNSMSDFGAVKLKGHGKGVTCVKFSKLYPLLLSTSKDTTIRAWKASNYSCCSIYRGHQYSVWCVDESPTGTYMASGSKDLTARLWSMERNFPLLTFVGHVQDIECIAFHPNGNYVATGSDDFSVRLWCVTSGKLMRVFNECKLSVTKLAFSPDGKMLAVGGEESKVRIFDLAAGCQLNEVRDHSAAISDITWHPNNKVLATGCRDGSLRLWDVKKLSPMHESSSGSSYSSLNRIMSLNQCESIVKLMFSKNETICCIGT